MAFRDICCLLQYQDDEETLPHPVWGFPNLDYLTLKLDPCRLVDAELTTLQSMPMLHPVVLTGVTHSNELNTHIPWAQLTSLTIDVIA